MADRFVSVIAPDGQEGEIPEAALDGALQAGFQLAGGGGPAPAAAAPQPERMVPVIAPDGQEGELPESQLERALNAGFKTPAQAAQERDYGDLGSQIAAGAEGVGQGVFLGAKTPVAALEALGATIGNRLFEQTDAGQERERIPYGAELDRAQRDVALREEYNPVTSGVGEGLGVVGATIATGGGSLGAQGAVRTGLTVASPTAALARGGAALAEQAMARIAPSALRGLARPAVGLLTQGAVEGAAYAAAKEVDDAIATGDYEGLAEKALSSAAKGAVLGAGTSLAGGAFFGAVERGVRATGRLVPAMRELAGESAYKAAVGRTSKKAIEAAERHGGAEAVGQTLLDEGIPLTASADEIHAAVSARADEVGQELATLRGEIDDLSGGKGMSRSKLWDRISRSVIAPLRASPINRDLGDRLANWLAPLKDKLTAHVSKPIAMSGPSRIGALRETLTSSKATLAELQAKLGSASPTELDAIEAVTKRLGEHGDQIAALEAKASKLSGAARSKVEAKLGKLREAMEDVTSPIEGRVADAVAARGELRALEERAASLKGASRKAIEAKVEAARAKLQTITGSVSGGARKAVAAKVEKLQTTIGEVEALLERDVAADTAARAGVRDANDRISFDQIHGLRRELDQRINWEQYAPDVALQARRDVRNAIEDFWIESADEVAQQAGQLGYAEKLRGLKTRYARLALARDQAEQAVITQLANRSTSLTDTIAGAAAGGAAGDPITGFLASQLHKYVRERGRGYVAVGLNRAANYLDRRLADQAMTAAAQTQQRLNQASLLKGLLSSAATPKAARAALTFEEVNQALAQYEPGSDEELELAQAAQHIAEDSPELAQALVAQRARQAAFIRSKSGPPPIQTPFGLRRLRDDVTNEKLARYIEAVRDPIAAAERLADGDVRPEDVEALEATAPKLLDELRRKAAITMSTADDPGYDARLRLGLALGIEADPSLAAENVAFYQQLAQTSPAAQSAPGRVSSFKTHGDALETKAQRVAQ